MIPWLHIKKYNSQQGWKLFGFIHYLLFQDQAANCNSWWRILIWGSGSSLSVLLLQVSSGKLVDIASWLTNVSGYLLGQLLLRMAIIMLSGLCSWRPSRSLPGFGNISVTSLLLFLPGIKLWRWPDPDADHPYKDSCYSATVYTIHFSFSVCAF